MNDERAAYFAIRNSLFPVHYSLTSNQYCRVTNHNTTAMSSRIAHAYRRFTGNHHSR